MAHQSYRKVLSIGMVLRDTVFITLPDKDVTFSSSYLLAILKFDICTDMRDKTVWTKYYEFLLGGGGAGHSASATGNPVSRT